MPMAIASRTRVGLVACSQLKRQAPAPAAQLYDRSPLFRKAARYAAATCDEWFILSARHGVVPPDRVIAPYDTALMSMTPARREHWALDVTEQLDHLLDGIAKPHLVVLAGRAYRGFLPHLQFHWTHEIPMAGLGIGEQLHWLDVHTPTGQQALSV